jgi:hypothetical protein
MGLGFAWAPMRRLSLAVLSVVMLAGVAQGACLDPRTQLPAQTVSTFLASPAQLLSQFPDGGPRMISQIRDLAASDPATLAAIIALLPNATKAQQEAIGTGLAQAARMCVRTDQAYAIQIQNALQASDNRNAIIAYTAAAGDVQIGGIAAGGGGGGTGGVGSTGATGSTGSTGGSTLLSDTLTGTTNSAQNFFTGATVNSGNLLSGTTTTTVSGSVSPSR